MKLWMYVVGYFTIGIIAAIIVYAIRCYKGEDMSSDDNVTLTMLAVIGWPVYLVVTTIVVGGTSLANGARRIKTRREQCSSSNAERR